MRRMSVKEYYYKIIWPKIRNSALDIDSAEREALRLYKNANWVKEAFKELKDKNIPPGRNWILEQHSREIISWFRAEKSFEHPVYVDVGEEFAKGNIFVGEFPTDELNASICFIPDAKGYLILFNSGMMNFLNEIVKIMISFTGFAEFSSSGELKKEKIRKVGFLTKEEAANYIQEMALLYKKTRKFTPARKIMNPDKELLDLQGKIIFSVEKFILAHEFAHCALGHLNNKTTKTLIVPHSSLSLDVILKTHEQELVADTLAAISPVLHNIPKDYDFRKDYLDEKRAMDMLHIVWGPLFFFSLIEIIDKVLNNVNSITHPSSSFRYRNIRNLYDRMLEDKFFIIFDLYRSFLEEIKNSL